MTERSGRGAHEQGQRARTKKVDEERVKVILQSDDETNGSLNAFLNRNGIRLGNHFANLNVRSIELPVDALEELASLPGVSFISEDSPVAVSGHITTTTGTEAVRHPSSPGGGGDAMLESRASLDGSGVGVAILDSGVAATHHAFQNVAGLSRVVANVNFTKNASAGDEFGVLVTDGVLVSDGVLFFPTPPQLLRAVATPPSNFAKTLSI